MDQGDRTGEESEPSESAELEEDAPRSMGGTAGIEPRDSSRAAAREEATREKRAVGGPEGLQTPEEVLRHGPKLPPGSRVPGPFWLGVVVAIFVAVVLIAIFR